MEFDAVLVGGKPPFLLRLAEKRAAVAVDHALAGNRDVGRLVREDEMAAAPLLADGIEVLGEDIVGVVVRRPLGAENRRALLEMQIAMVLEPDRAALPDARWHDDAPATRLRGGLCRLGDTAAVVAGIEIHLPPRLSRAHKCRARGQHNRQYYFHIPLFT